MILLAFLLLLVLCNWLDWRMCAHTYGILAYEHEDCSVMFHVIWISFFVHIPSSSAGGIVAVFCRDESVQEAGARGTWEALLLVDCGIGHTFTLSSRCLPAHVEQTFIACIVVCCADDRILHVIQSNYSAAGGVQLHWQGPKWNHIYAGIARITRFHVRISHCVVIGVCISLWDRLSKVGFIFWRYRHLHSLPAGT